MESQLKINEMYRVGHAKYVVMYYTGKKHEDGSDFYDMAIFKNQAKKNAFIATLRASSQKAGQ